MSIIYFTQDLLHDHYLRGVHPDRSAVEIQYDAVYTEGTLPQGRISS